MKSNKLLSIIIPVYNAEDSIRRCLNSIVPQLKDEYELLLFNDGSKDNSIAVMREYESKYPTMIKAYDQDNMGAANTRNRGIQEAQGKYVMFIDNDDFVDGHYFETMIAEAERTESEVVLCAYDRRDEEKVYYTYKPSEKSSWYQFMVPTPWAKIYDREFLLEHEITYLDYPLNEDVYFCLKCYKYANKISQIDYVGYHWYFNENSVSNTSQKGFKDNVDIAYLMDKLYEPNVPEDEMYQFFYTRHMIWYLLFAGRNSSKQAFLEEYHKVDKWSKDHGFKWRYPLLSKKTAGELFSRKAVICIFVMIRKLHLIRLFASVYCKG